MPKKTTPAAGLKTITLPSGCKPSKACGTDLIRPVLTNAWLTRRNDGLWLLATDSYLAVALKVDGDADEGWVPLEVLKKLESREYERGKLIIEQISATEWKVSTTDKTVVSIYTANVGTAAKFPNVDTVYDNLLFEGAKPSGSSDPFGFNPDFMARIGAALGSALRVEVTESLKPIRLTAVGRPDRFAIQMPIRLMEASTYASLKAAA